MDDAAALVWRQLGGADVHPAVELHGVGVDHLGTDPLGGEEFGQIEGEGGFPGPGGADDRDRPVRGAVQFRDGEAGRYIWPGTHSLQP
ncbi:hypothetical protein MINS_22240 [Mycolicibacterium insubricum]|nr:hypothetical protein MINS_22240 [Mycolicibacterium insubricum]